MAINHIEREEGDDVVGLFVQGADGDMNTCVVHKPDAWDDTPSKKVNIPMKTVHATALGKLIKRLEKGQPLCNPTVVFGMRIGPISFLGSSFETFQATKNEVVEKALMDLDHTLTMSP